MLKKFRKKINYENMEELKKYFPDKYVKNLLKIKGEYLKEKNIKGVVLDLDNTIIDYDNNVLLGFVEWKKDLNKNGIQTIILTNNFIKKRIESVSKPLGMEYVKFARKPKEHGFDKAAKKLGLKREEIAVIGDQIHTDILGGNKAGMHTILVEPITEKRDYLITKLKRKSEKKIIEKYFEYLQKEENN